MALVSDNLQDTMSWSYHRSFSDTTFCTISHHVLTLDSAFSNHFNSGPSSSLCICSLVQTPITSLPGYFNLLFLSELDLHCCAWALSSCGEQGLLFAAVRGLLIAVASLVAEHGL